MAEYIEREALIAQVKAIHKAVDTSNINISYDSGFHSATSQIQGLIAWMPAADVAEVRHGKLNDIVDFGNGICVGYCSNCGTEHRAINPSVLKLSYRHCRWCGAKMDGKENGNE